MFGTQNICSALAETLKSAYLLVMEPFTAIAGAILQTVAAAGTKRLGTTLEGVVTRRRESQDKLAAYLVQLTNVTSYFLTYRINRQHISDAYVKPRLLNCALARTHIQPTQFRAVQQAIESHDHRFADDISSRIESTRYVEMHATYIPVDELCASQSDCIVLGDAGDGKSSLLSYLCWARLKSPHPRLPIFVDSRQLRDSTLTASIGTFLQDAGIDAQGTSFASLSHALSVYVDGLDELPSSSYASACLEINTLNAASPDIQFTLACRSGAYKGDFAHMQEVSIAPFTYDQIQEFIYGWYAGITDGPLASELLDQIKTSDRLRELATKPLIVALMCSAFRRYLNLSRRPTALFQQCIDALLWEWDAKRTVRREGTFAQLDLEKKVWLHSLLAAKLHNAGMKVCDVRLPLNTLASDLPKFGIPASHATAVLNELVAHHSLFVKWTEETYGFSHLAIQEFLTALWYRNDRRWEALLADEYINSAWWEYVIALCIASMDDATDAIQRLYSNAASSEIRRLEITAHCLRYDPIVDAELREEIIRKILHWYHNGDLTHHDAAVYMLVGMEDEWTAPMIRRSLAGTLRPSELAEVLSARIERRGSGWLPQSRQTDAQ